MDIEIGDDGFGLREVFPVAAGSNTTYSFTYDNFTLGHNTSMGVVKASFRWVIIEYIVYMVSASDSNGGSGGSEELKGQTTVKFAAISL